jgi:hypothetical protein
MQTRGLSGSNNGPKGAYNPELGMMSAIKEEEESKLYGDNSIIDDINVSRIEGGGGIIGGGSDNDGNTRNSYGYQDN